MSAVRGTRELFHPNKIQITIERERDPQEVQNEINKPLPERVQHIRTIGKTSEYLVDNLVKVVTPSVAHSIDQARLWEKLRNLDLIGVAIPAFATGGEIGAIIAYKQNGKNLPSPYVVYSAMLVGAVLIFVFIRKSILSSSQLFWWNTRPEFIVARTRALAYQKEIQSETITFGEGKAQLILSAREAQYLYGDKKSYS